MNEMYSFGTWVRRCRRGLDLTREELAQQVGCAAGTIRKIESDERRPSKQLAARLAQCLGISPEQHTTFLKVARAEQTVDRLPQPMIPALMPPPSPRPRTNLPRQLTSFIGREQEMTTICAQLRHATTRLVTLTGPGGSGKTRLALQVAAELQERFADGVFFVDLAPIRDPQLLSSTIAQVLGVTEKNQVPLLQTLGEYLGRRQLLLVLDNFEQILEAASGIVHLLQAAPGLAVLVTSRVVLKVRGEKEFAVPPLNLPDLQRLPLLERLTQYEAVQLFVERARDVRPGFEMTNSTAPFVAEICHRLDGLPLAIELAAARIRVLPPEPLLQRLGQRLALLTGGPRDLPQRQQTLRNTIDWSYQLLDEEEQRLFYRLGVFVDGSTIEAIAAICNAENDLGLEVLDGLTTLVEQSLLRQEEATGEPRFVLLETLREYALEQLERSGEAAALRQRHAAYYRGLGQQAAPQFTGPEQADWLRRLDRDHANLCATLDWLLTHGEAEHALALAADLVLFWYMRDHWREGRIWLERCLAAAPRAPAAVRAAALEGLGWMCHLLRRHDQAKAHFEQSLRLYAGVGDRAGMAQVHMNLGMNARWRGDYRAAQDRFEKALLMAHQGGSPWLVARILQNLGSSAAEHQQYDQALQYLAESATRFKELGDPFNLGEVLKRIGMVHVFRGALAEAASHFEHALALQQQLDARVDMLLTLVWMGVLGLHQQDYISARTLLRQALAIAAEREEDTGMVYTLFFLGCVAAAVGDLQRAARLLGAAEALRERYYKAPLPPTFQAMVDACHAQTLERLHAQLDQATIDVLWAEGRAMSQQEVIAYGVRDEGADAPE